MALRSKAWLIIAIKALVTKEAKTRVTLGASKVKIKGQSSVEKTNRSARNDSNN